MFQKFDLVTYLLTPTSPIFELYPDIIKTNMLSKFEKYWVKTVAAKVLTRKFNRLTMTTDDEHSSILKAHPEQGSGELIKSVFYDVTYTAKIYNNFIYTLNLIFICRSVNNIN